MTNKVKYILIFIAYFIALNLISPLVQDWLFQDDRPYVDIIMQPLNMTIRFFLAFLLTMNEYYTRDK